MIYVFDTNIFRVVDHYYPTRFPTFWQELNRLVENGSIVSVREVRRELENQHVRSHLEEWINEHRDIFLLPQPAETEFVSEVFSIPHFQQLISRRNRLQAMPVADPFIVASAHCRQGFVVTEEKYKPNAAKIPNVCEHFGVNCLSLEEFMTQEGWAF